MNVRSRARPNTKMVELGSSVGGNCHDIVHFSISAISTCLLSGFLTVFIAQYEKRAILRGHDGRLGTSPQHVLVSIVDSTDK